MNFIDATKRVMLRRWRYDEEVLDTNNNHATQRPRKPSPTAVRSASRNNINSGSSSSKNGSNVARVRARYTHKRIAIVVECDCVSSDMLVHTELHNIPAQPLSFNERPGQCSSYGALLYPMLKNMCTCIPCKQFGHFCVACATTQTSLEIRMVSMDGNLEGASLGKMSFHIDTFSMFCGFAFELSLKTNHQRNAIRLCSSVAQLNSIKIQTPPHHISTFIPIIFVGPFRFRPCHKSLKTASAKRLQLTNFL